MRRLALLEHLSLDGFLAGPNGEMDWIHVDDDLFAFVNQIFHTADTAIYGRVTYDMMNSYWPTAGDAPGASVHDVEHSRWLDEASILVVSQSLQEPVAWGNRGKTAQVVRSVDAIAEAKAQQGQDLVAIGSARLAQSLVQRGLVDDYWLFINPIILGGGMSLFSERDEAQKLELVDTRRFGGGVVSLRYGLAPID
jgi:dihydrofolate reductase